MQVLTSLVLAAFAAYAGLWYFGRIEGNFALLLFMATVVTGLYWLAERFYFLPARRRAVARVGFSHRVTAQETVKWFQQKVGVFDFI